MDVDYPRALLAVLALAVGLGIVFAASTSASAFGLYNAAWDGASDLRDVAEDSGTETTVVRNTTRYGDVRPNGTIAIVLAPETGYESEESSRIRRFVEAGGTLVVAEDFEPHANSLLSAVGASARIDGRPLRDERQYYRAPGLPVATGIADHRYTAGVDEFTLNHGSAIDPGGARPLVNTSGTAYVDANGNGELEDSEELGRYPVVTIEDVEAGQVVVVSDPSALINVMLERPGNRAFVEALFDNHERVLLDTSHAGGLPPLAVALLVIRESAMLQAMVGLLAIGAVGLWARWSLTQLESALPVERIPWSTNRGPPSEHIHASDASREGLATLLRQRHPDWDEDRIDRVVSHVVHRRDEQ